VYFSTSDAGKEVALKRIQRNMDVELRGVRQCLNLKHVNLISLWDIKYDDEGEAWVVMEYIAGESLRDVVEKYPRGMPVDKVHQWFEGIVAGVAYLHDHGIVHRDLKPGNIFEDDDVVKIGDYGLSKFISCSRRSGQTESVGTCHYMAPEIGKGVYGKEIDIYALGVILYELLTGDVPFDGESSQEIIMKHLTAEPDVSAIAAPYRSVIRKALAKDAELRYRDVREMLKDLQARPTSSSHRAVDPVMEIGDDEGKTPFVIADEDSETLFISGHDDMVLGDVQDIVDAEPTPRPPVRQAPRQRHMRNEATVAAPTAAEGEPIARAVQSGWGSTKEWWNNANFSNPVKVLLLIGAAVVLIVNAQWLIPVLVLLGIAYLVYLGARAVTVGANGGDKPHSSPTTPREETVASSSGTRHVRSSRRAVLEHVLSQRTATERLTELTGSMLLSAVICGVLCIVAMIVGGASFANSLDDWSFYAWMTMTAVCGSWVVLCVAKLFEVAGGDQIRQRFVMLVSGLALGTMAFGFQQLLQPSIEFNQSDRPFAEVFSLPTSMVNGSEVLLPAYLAYFGGLFLILRWWKQSDPLRRSRLSLWATGLCVLWALIIDVFPQPWGFLLSATIATAVQLSAPWVSPKERLKICQLHQQA